jgi:heptosyltransferase-1
VPRLLIVKTSSLGDVVHALPAVTDLHRARPEFRIDWLVEEPFADIPALHPAVASVIPCALRRWRRTPLARGVRREVADLRSALSAADHDVVLDLQGLAKSAWLARMPAGRKHGYDWRSIREPLASLFYDVRHRVPRDLHAVARNRLLAAAAFGYEVEGPPDYGLELSAGERRQRLVVCFHATSRDDKLWPEERWRLLIAAFAQRGLAVLLPWSAPEERERSLRLARGYPTAEVPERMSIAALARRCSAALGVVGVDTGLTHLAAAVGVPVIALYCATDPGLTGVVAGRAPARNLGSAHVSPAVEDVLACVREIFPE